MLEIEMKFRVSSFDALAEKLTAWNAAPEEPLEEADHYFCAPDRDFARTDEAVRLRRVGAENIATYKGPKEAGPTKTRTELEVPLKPGSETADAFCRFLTHLRYRPVAVVYKRRKAYAFKRQGFAFQACLDEVDNLGLFVEVEIVAPESERESAQKALLEVVAALGLGAVERRSYLEMTLVHAETEQKK